MGTKPQTMTADGEFCVYLGPTIVGVIQYGAIYMGSKEQALESVAERAPPPQHRPALCCAG